MTDSALLHSLANLSPEKRALLLRMLRAAPEPIAIVGMACRLPGGAHDAGRFWDLLLNGRDAVTRVPADRWPADAYYDRDPGAPGKMNSPYGAFLDRVDQFDAAFFGISPREASRMDPQQRLFLEVAWEALENAGQTIAGLAGSQTGVFAAVYQSDYSWLLFEDEHNVDAYMASGLSHAILANRLSYFLDLRGPSLAIDTACSSSLVAFHLACESLRHDDCDLAITGGVSLMLSPTSALPIAKWGMMSPDGRCKTFDARANGFVRGEGCGVLVLKRLEDARRDRDRILAVCRGSAVNQDGRTNVLTAPNGLSQKRVIEQALRAAGLQGRQMGYIEAHGTGTALGDPIEMEALVDVIGRGRSPGEPCFVGSVKTNIGHLEAAAGVASLIKVVLALRHQAIPPHLHFRDLNPHIALDGVPFVIPLQPVPWTAQAGEPRRAGVSSFGFGGTNAHVVLEEPPPDDRSIPPVGADDETHLFVLSAAQASALPALAAAFREELVLWRSDGTTRLADICHSAACRRSHFHHRLAIVCRSFDQLESGLNDYLAGRANPLLSTGRRLPGDVEKIAFVYAGQGTQWVGAGQRLLERSPVFRGEMEHWDGRFRPLVGWSLLAELTASQSTSRLHETAVAQPVIFAIQMSLTALWQSWGIQPAAVVGHSLGEVAAACVAGALSPAQAADIVSVRARLLQPLTGRGRMALADVQLEAVRADLDRQPLVSLAALNTPDSVVVSGDTTTLEALLAAWREKGIQARYIPVHYAFQGPQVQPLGPQLVAALSGLKPQKARLPLASTVSADFVPGEALDAQYWGRNLTQPVLFAPALKRLAEAGHTVFLEVSPHPALSLDMQQCLERANQRGIVLGSLRRDEDDEVSMTIALGRLYAAGGSPDWARVYGDRGRFVPLPSYAWQRKRYWIERSPGTPSRARAKTDRPAHPLLGAGSRPAPTDGSSVLFERVFSAQSPAYQQDHRIHDVLVVPATSYLEMVTAAGGIIFGAGHHRLRDVVIRDALLIPEAGEVSVQLAFSDVREGEGASFRILASETGTGGEWRLYAHGRISVAAHTGSSSAAREFDPDAIRSRCRHEMDGLVYYERGRQAGGQLGSRFNAIRHLWRRQGEVLARLDLSHLDAGDVSGYLMYPPFADAAFHIAYAGLEGDGVDGGILMPIGFDDVCYFEAPEGETWCHYEVRSSTADAVVGDTRLYSAAGALLAEATGVRYRRATEQTLRRRHRQESKQWIYRVRWRPSSREQPAAGGQASPLRGWLILADDGGYGAALAETLQQQNETVVVAQAGGRGALEWMDDHSARLSPSEPGQYQALLASQRLQDLAPVWQVVHLWGLNAVPFPSLLSALYLVQAVVQQQTDTPAKLWCVTRAAQPATAGDLNVAASPLWGFGRTVALEHPRHWGGLIDVDHGSPREAAARLAAELLQPDGEDQVAWRGHQRLVARLARYPVSMEERSGLQFDAGATYLVTGGLGAIGRRVALWLVEHGARQIVLVSRSGRSDLDSGLVQRAREAGAEIRIRSADVAQIEELASVCRELKAPLKGVFHAAGEVADGAVSHLSRERFEQALSAKVAGAWNLHQLTRDRPLDWFVLFSSAAAILGSPGQSNYAAGNAFMDALAHQRRAQNLPAVSINWGPWDLGMAAALGERGLRRWEAWGMGVMKPGHAMEVMSWLRTGTEPQLAVLPLRWPPADPEIARRVAGRRFFEEIAQELPPVTTRPRAEAGGIRERLQGTPARRRRQVLADYLRDRIRVVLRSEPDDDIDSNQGLFDLGMDSLTAVELKEALETEIGQPLPATLVFDHPTIEDLTDYLHTMLGGDDRREHQPASASGPADADDRLSSLSEQELVALLAQELGDIRREGVK